MQKIFSFEPVAGSHPVLLILGSMPSTRSLALHRYYGHARNHFWPVLSALLNQPLPETYEARIAMVKKHRLALWDVAGSCQRSGSLDSSIKAVQANDIPGFLLSHPSVRTVVFNGRTAQNLCDRFFERLPGITYLFLPSTSPIPTAECNNLEQKIHAWHALAAFLPNAE